MNCLVILLAALALSDAQRGWLNQHGKLVFVADTDYPPYTFTDSDGQSRGLDADVARAVGRVLGVEVEVRPVHWNEALQLVRQDRADVLAGMVQSDERKDLWTFVEPHADVQYFLFVREDVRTIHELKDLEGTRVGVGRGSLVEPVLRDNSKITVVNYDRGRGMGELLNREISAFAGNLVVQSHFIEAKDVHGIKVVGSPLIPPLPYGMAIPRGKHDELVGILNMAVMELRSQGELATLQRKWFGDVLRPPLITKQALRGLRIGLAVLAGLAGLGILRSWELRRMVRRKTARISALHALARSFGEARDVMGVLDRAMEVLDPLMKPDAVYVIVGNDEARLVRSVRFPDDQVAELESTGNLKGSVCLPIVAEGMTLGAFGVLSRRALPDMDFMQAVAAELGIAIANASLFATLERRVTERTAQLNARNQQLEADLSMAREVQVALQPLLNSSAVEIARQGGENPLALWMTNRTSTARMVGGDFFNVMRPTPDTCCVFICDVMGQGARAALLTAILRTLLDKLTDDPRDARRFMSELNRRLMAVLRTQETPIFATAFYACFDFAAQQVTFANAGHPWPVLFDRPQSRWSLLGDGKRPGPALGIFEDAEFPQDVALLSPGQAWLLYTDGLYETVNDAGESFGMERVQAILNEQPARPVAQVLDGLMKDLARFTGHQEVDDDVCLLAVEAKRVE